ncbi:hypothetical protein KGF57_004129 [Candida theae]|uniref:Ammonia transport outward protein 2 n=1 Tax=Candida theae TaxID=1198502 RepID=A0AAD5BCL5_9ASCO|nr:uncharacterized protein KGF57_004129 [Candida theae]KAI5952923.1 hypothetical protein KGF57_004129 [Candida theae]
MVSLEENNEPEPLTPLEAGPSNPQFIPQTSMHSTLISDDERTVINNQKVLRRDLKRPSAGEFSPGYSTWPHNNWGNASAVGLAGFALTAFVAGLILARAMGITTLNAVMGAAVFYGGVVQFIAGLCEVFIGNTFAATAFVSYGSFWMSFGAIFIPTFGIIEAYGGADNDDFGDAAGFFLLGWAIFTFLMLLCTFKSTWPFVLLFFTLDLGFFLLAAGFMRQSVRCIRGGGVVIVLSSLFGWYSCFSGVTNRFNSYIVFPTLPLRVFHNKTKTLPA